MLTRASPLGKQAVAKHLIVRSFSSPLVTKCSRSMLSSFQNLFYDCNFTDVYYKLYFGLVLRVLLVCRVQGDNGDSLFLRAYRN
jgi:hypothetical protein